MWAEDFAKLKTRNEDKEKGGVFLHRLLFLSSLGFS